MDKELIERLARDAGVVLGYPVTTEILGRFAELVAVHCISRMSNWGTYEDEEALRHELGLPVDPKGPHGASKTGLIASGEANCPPNARTAR
jgi:hypothetical protein